MSVELLKQLLGIENLDLVVLDDVEEYARLLTPPAPPAPARRSLPMSWYLGALSLFLMLVELG